MRHLDRRTAIAALALAGWAPLRAEGAAPPELRRTWPEARLGGQGRLRFFGLHVYDIRLWSPAALQPGRWHEAPLALEIRYARDLVGRLIAERSVQEMQRQAVLPAARAAAWRAEMERLFPDVREGDRLTGIYLPGEAARFYYNGERRGEVRDAEFARLFFGIWLAPETSEPDLRRRLLGGGA